MSGAALLGAWAALRLSGPFRAGADLAALVSGMPDLAASQRAEIDCVAGSALHLLGDALSARAHFDAGLTLARTAGHRHCEARLLVAIAAQRSTQGHHRDAFDDLTRALALASELDDRSLRCLVVNALGTLSENQSQLEEARGYYETALNLARELGDRRLEGGLLGNLGMLHAEHGRVDEARSHYEMGLGLAQQVGDRRWEGNARCNLGLLHHEQGRGALARSQFETALTMARELGHVRLECTVLCNLGLVLEAQGELDDAQHHYEKAVAVAHELGDRRLEGQSRGYLGLLQARLRCIGESRASLAAGEALLLEASDRLSLALLLCGRAQAEHLAGDAAAARDYWQRAQALAAQMQVGPASELGRALAQLQTLFEPSASVDTG